MNLQTIRNATLPLSTLGFISGVLYSWAYWDTFNINIFSFAGFMDLINAALIPVGSLLAVSFVGFVLGEIATSDVKLGGGSAWIQERLWVTKVGIALVTLYLIFVFYVIFSPFPGKWTVLPILITMLLYFPAKRSGFLSEIESDSIRSVVVFAVIFTPISAFCIGKNQAEGILNNIPGTIYESRSGHKYLGHVNGFVFLLTEDNAEVIVEMISDYGAIVLFQEKGVDGA